MLQRLLKYCSGRHTAFALFFTVMGTIMAWFHRLDPSYVALIGAIQAFVFAHSTKESYFEDRKPDEKNDDSK